MGDPGGAGRAELFGEPLPAMPDVLLPVRTCWRGGDMGPKLLAAAFLFFGESRFVAVEMNVVGIDAEQKVGARSRSSRDKPGFHTDGKQQQRMGRGDRAAEAIRAKEASGRGIAGGSMFVDLRRQCRHVGFLPSHGILRGRDLGVDPSQLGLVERPLPDEQGGPPLRSLGPRDGPIMGRLQLPEFGRPCPKYGRGHPFGNIWSFRDRSHAADPFLNRNLGPIL